MSHPLSDLLQTVYDQNLLPVTLSGRPNVIFFNGYQDGDTLDVTDGVPVPLECTVRRSFPFPHFSLHIHNRSAHSFHTTNVTTHVYCPPRAWWVSDVSKACPVHADHDVTMFMPEFRAHLRDDGRILTCSAALPNSNWLPIVTSLRLNVRCKCRM